MGNLMSLCRPCHDYVEGQGWTRHEIMRGFEPNPPIDYSQLDHELGYPDDTEDWRGIDWRIRVYGGVKDIKVARQIMADNADQDELGISKGL